MTTQQQIDLTSPITQLRSVGTRSAVRLAKLGIRTVKNLLWHLPARYEDYSQSVPIAQVVPGEKMSIQGRILAIATRHIWPRRMTITTATVQDDSGAIRAVWFNQPYLTESLAEGTPVSMAGKIVLDKRGLYIASPVYEKTAGPGDSPGELRHTGRLVPIYPETDGITSKYLRYLLQPLLESVAFEDPVPAVIREKFGLENLDAAVKTVHYPVDASLVPRAKERLAFDDLLLFQLKAFHERRQVNKLRSVRVATDNTYMKQVVATLPFVLTKDQRVAAAEILKDMERGYPMNRLLEGDVGSGKTVVALLAALNASRQGLQTVILAPTEVLAVQHYSTLMGALAEQSGVQAALLTGTEARVNSEAVTKASVKRVIAAGEVHIIVGTHALLQGDVRFKALALVVIDEQHRFGIAQRAALVGVSRTTRGRVPHLLSMTATPIPRTLALTIFGDLDISLIHEKPEGRKPIKTNVVPPERRADMYEFIRSQIKEGRQVFVICPVIEQSAAKEQPGKPGTKLRQTKLNPLWAQVKAVQDEYARLSTSIFPDAKVAMLHGRMKAKEKQAVMQEFKEG